MSRGTVWHHMEARERSRENWDGRNWREGIEGVLLEVKSTGGGEHAVNGGLNLRKIHLQKLYNCKR